jgi:hypothetical protein
MRISENKFTQFYQNFNLLACLTKRASMAGKILASQKLENKFILARMIKCSGSFNE